MIWKRAASLAVSTAFLAFTAPAFAHGGQYRGPGDIVPPNPGGHGGSGGRTGQPGGPSTPGPSGPSVPGRTGPGTGGPGTGPNGPGTGGGRTGTGGTTGGVGLSLQDDYTQWQFWWEFNKDAFLRLKDAIHSDAVLSGGFDYEVGRHSRTAAKDTLEPSDQDRQTKMIPALLKALRDPSSNRDIVSSCMIALAKIGSTSDPKRFKEEILPVFKDFLANSVQEKRETAALAMGITALPEAVPELLELAKNTQGGKKLVGGGDVDYRTRAFSCYGLGLIAYRNNDPDLKTKIFGAMKTITDDENERRDLLVAALNAMRLLRPDVSTDAGAKLQKEVVEYALTFLANDQIYDQIRAHSIATMAKILEQAGDEKLREIVVARCLEILDPRQREWKQWTQQSAVQALGALARPENAKALRILERYMKDGKDAQARNFSAIALGQIGGEEARELLYKQLRKSSVQKMYKPWLALGLAIRDFELRKKDSSYDGDPTIGDALVRQMKENRNGLFAAGYAVALGIMRHEDASDAIVSRLLELKNQEEPAGYFMIGLGMMRAHTAKGDIRAIVHGATRREKLLTQGSIALGLLGDKDIAHELVRKMEEKGSVAVMSALAQALGFIGDRHSIDPLCDILANKSMKDIPRAFAAVALGLVGDKEDLPWNSKIAADLNYRANVETLTSNSGGILDIL